MASPVSIDADLCIGSGECVRLAPDGFVLDEDLGVSVPTGGAEAVPLDILQAAMDACPTGAITIALEAERVP